MINVISTKVSLFRNLKEYKFTHKLTEENRQEIANKVGKVLGDKIDAKVVLFNGEHITFNKECLGFDKSIFETVLKISNLLKNKINLAYSDEYGYLTSDISKLGTGIKIESRISLSCLKEINKIEQVKSNVRKLRFDLRASEKENVYIISTICSLGYTENEIIEEFEKMLNRLQELEIESAKLLDVTNHDEIVDKVYRSLAICKSAYIMNYDELNLHLTNIRTGINLGIIDLNADTLKELQKLAINNSDIISKSELLILAKNARDLLKGDKNV